MKEKLIIKNFGPIKNVELELGRFNVLIGEQATGKSAITKLLYVISGIDFLSNPSKRNDLIESYGLFFKKDSKIKYVTKDYTIIYNSGKFDVKFSKKLTENISEELTTTKKLVSKGNYDILISFFIFNKLIQKDIKGYHYIPAERIALANALRLLLNTANRSVFKNNFDQYIIDFANAYNIASEKISNLQIPHLKNVVFEKINGFDKVKFNDEILFLYQASSGFQVSIPLVVFLEHYNGLKMGVNKFLIEEPELNLFPTAQYHLIKFFAEKLNQSKNSISLTTHSPYILTSLNNLMYAYNVGQKNKEEVSKIIEEKYWVNPNDVSAYMLLSNGTAESIIDSEGLIRASKIDGISGILNKEFNDIMNIELNIKDEADS